MVDWKFLEELIKEPDTDSLKAPWHAGRLGCLSVEVVDKLASTLKVHHLVIDDLCKFPMRTAIDLSTGEEVTTYNGADFNEMIDRVARKEMERMMLRTYSQNSG